MNSRWTLAAGALLMAVATIAGALGSHALHGQLSARSLEIYETAVRYQFYHSLGLLGIGLTVRGTEHPLVRLAAACVLAGVILFSGSLYALSFGAPRWLGAVTPLGGLALIGGWLMFVVGVVSKAR
jgi:uncharacterized membrane protein YgdD (TMEM256/DUF423 family)